MKKAIPYLLGTILGAFGTLTLFLSASVIFDFFDIRAKEGNYVLFVVWVNFISSLLYLLAAYGFINAKKWTSKLLTTSSILLILAFVGLIFHINFDGIYENKTIGAMIFRISITIFFATIAFYTISRKKIILN